MEKNWQMSLWCFDAEIEAHFHPEQRMGETVFDGLSKSTAWVDESGVHRVI